MSYLPRNVEKEMELHDILMFLKTRDLLNLQIPKKILEGKWNQGMKRKITEFKACNNNNYFLRTPTENSISIRELFFRSAKYGVKQIPYQEEIPIIIKQSHFRNGFHLAIMDHVASI